MAAKEHPPVLGRMIGTFSVSLTLRFVRMALNIAVIGLLGRYLGDVGMGQLFSALAIISVLQCVAELGFARITVRELVRAPQEEDQILGTTFYTRSMIGLVMLAGIFIATRGMGETERMLLLAYGMLLPTHGFAELGSWLEARGLIARNAVLQLAGFAFSALLIGMGVWLRLPHIFFPLAYVMECWITGALQLHLMHRLGGHMRRWSWQSARAFSLLRESWPEMIAQLGLILLFRIDTIMVKLIQGDAAAGIYAGAVRVSEVLYFIPPMLASVLLPRLIELQSRDRASYERRFADYFATTLLIAVIGAGTLAFAAPYLIALLWGGQLTGSTDILRIHAWSFIPYAIGIARTQFLAAEGKLAANLPCVLLALAINIALNLAWIPIWSGEGAAWATLVSYTIAWVLTSFLLPSLHSTARLFCRSLAKIPHVIGECLSHARERVCGSDDPPSAPAQVLSAQCSVEAALLAVRGPNQKPGSEN